MSNHDLEPNTALHPDNDSNSRPDDHPNGQPAEDSIALRPAAGGDSPEHEVGAARLDPERQTFSPARPIFDRRRAANRLNAQKSTGPRTDSGKQRVSQNARKLSIRLLGLAEARTLNQDLDAGGELYRQLIAPYEPAPPLLARQFEDLARLYLELEAWERIRDAQLEDRWQQSDIERRQRFFEMERDLQGTNEEVFKNGLCRLPDSAAKSKRQVESLGILKDHLLRRDFDMASMLHYLYGKELNPPSDRALTICMGCERLMDREKRSSVTEEQLESLLNVVAEEEQAALTAYSLRLDEKTLTRAGSLARLAPTRDDHWMNRHAERLRHDIDRKLKLILTLLEIYGLEERPRYRSSHRPRPGNGVPDSGSQPGPSAGSDPGAALPPPKPLRRSRPARHRVKRQNAQIGKRAGARVNDKAIHTRHSRGSRNPGGLLRGRHCGPGRSSTLYCAGEGRGFNPPTLSHQPRQVSPLPQGEGMGVREGLAGGWAEAQPLSVPAVETRLRGGDQKRSGRDSKGRLQCTQKVSKTKPGSPLESTNRSKNGTKQSQFDAVAGWRWLVAGYELLGGRWHRQAAFTSPQGACLRGRADR